MTYIANWSKGFAPVCGCNMWYSNSTKESLQTDVTGYLRQFDISEREAPYDVSHSIMYHGQVQRQCKKFDFSAPLDISSALPPVQGLDSLLLASINFIPGTSSFSSVGELLQTVLQTNRIGTLRHQGPYMSSALQWNAGQTIVVDLVSLIDT